MTVLEQRMMEAIIQMNGVMGQMTEAIKEIGMGVADMNGKLANLTESVDRVAEELKYLR